MNILKTSGVLYISYIFRRVKAIVNIDVWSSYNLTDFTINVTILSASRYRDNFRKSFHNFCDYLWTSLNILHRLLKEYRLIFLWEIELYNFHTYSMYMETMSYSLIKNPPTPYWSVIKVFVKNYVTIWFNIFVFCEINSMQWNPLSDTEKRSTWH
jgi:hypothetical protein